MTYTVTANRKETRFIDGYIEAIYFTERVCLPDNIDRDWETASI